MHEFSAILDFTEMSADRPNAQTRRLLQELQDYEKNPLPFIEHLQYSVDTNGFNQLTGVLIGPTGSPYERGHFRFCIRFPLEYPFKAHEFRFLTKICHPNVDSSKGLVCHDEMIFAWTPKISISQLLSKMHVFLAEPKYSKPVVEREASEKSVEKARQWTEEFALVTI